MHDLESKIEGILFAMGESVTADSIAMALGISTYEAETVIQDMQSRWESENRGIRIVKLDDSYQMCTSKHVYESLIKIAKQPKKYAMTDVLLETLSIIAYKQPITKAEIERIRGVSSDHAVNRLVEFSLVEEIGRLEAPGRPMLFGTTKDFLRSFGIASLTDLPVLDREDIERMRMESYDEVDAGLSV